MRALAVALVVAVVGACSHVGSAPAAVQRTLVGVESLGLACGEGIRDNVPSGLSQWRCASSGDAASTVLVDGNDEGVAGITFVTVPADAASTRAAFGRLVAGVEPLSNAPAIAATLATWSGSQQSSELGGVRVSAVCDAIQCIVMVVNAESAIRPLPLP